MPRELKPRERTRRRRWLLRVFLLLLVAAVVAGSLFLARLDEWSRVLVERQLGSALRANVSIGALDVSPLRLQVDFTDVVAENAPGEPGRFRVVLPWGRVRLHWSAFPDLGSRRIHLAELVLDRPEIETDREFLAARRGGGEASRFFLRIDRLDLVGGSWTHEERETPMDLGIRGLELSGATAGTRAATGSARLQFVVQRPPLAEELLLDVDTHFRWRDDRVDLMGLAARGGGADVELDGDVSWRDGLSLRCQGRASADADVLNGMLSQGFPPIGGQVSGPIEVSLGPDPLRVEGELVARRGRFGRLQADEVRARATYLPGRLELHQLQGRSFGGSVSGEVSVSLADPATFDVALDGRGVSTSSLMRWLRLDLPLAGRADGRFRLSGVAEDESSWTGEGTFSIEPLVGEGGVPVRGSGEFRIGEGRVSLRADPVETAAARFLVDLEHGMAAGTRGSVELDGTTADARRTHQAILQILHSLQIDVPDLLRHAVDGHGRLRAKIDLGAVPLIGLGARLEQGAWGPQEFDVLELELEHRGEDLVVRNVELAAGDSRLAAELALGTRDMRIRRATARAVKLDVEKILTLFDLPTELSGLYSGTLRLRKADGGLRGGGRAVVERGRLFGERFDRGEAELVVAGEQFELRGLRLSGSDLEAEGSVAWNPYAGDLGIAIERGVIGLAGIEALAGRGLQLDGGVEIRGRIELAADDVDGELTLAGRDVVIHDLPLGDMDGGVELSAEGCRAQLRGSGDRGWDLDAALGWTPELPVEGVLRLVGLTLDLVEDHDPPLWVSLSGEADFQGPLARPGEIRVRGSLNEVDLSLGARRLELQQQLGVELNSGMLNVGPLRMAGADSAIDARAELEVESRSLSASLRGDLDLGLVSAVAPMLRGSGQVAVDLTAGGTLDRPDYSGKVALERGRLRWLGFGQTLERLAVTMNLQGTRVTFDDLRGVIGGGEIGGRGEVRLGSGGVEHVDLALDGTAVGMTWPEDFEGLYDGRLLIQGDAEQVLIRGRVEMLRGLFAKELDFARLLGYGTREYSADDLEGLAEKVFFDVDLFADDEVWLRNKLAEVESRFDLHLGGTLEHPEVTGRMWMLEGGKIEFRDVKYNIASGSLDFVDLQRINPYLVLRAETSVGIYDVNLRVEGTMDQFEYELTSTPSLSQQDIIVLLTTGRTLQELTASGGGTQFTGDLAANYFAGALTDRFANQLERLLRLERVQINPLLAQGDADPTTRITLGKEVADNVVVVVSSDLGSTERQLYQVEWQATKKLQFTVRDETTSGIGGDLRYSDRFWIKRPPKQADVPAPIKPGVPPTASVSRVVGRVSIEGVPDELAARLLKQVPLRPGGEYRRSQIFEGSQRLRRYFVQQNRLQPQVDAESEPGQSASASVDVVYRVNPGPEFDIVLEGIKAKEQKRVRGHLEKLWTESLFIGDILSDSADVIGDYYRDRGYYAVDVQPLEQREGGRRVLRFDIDRGKPVRVGAVTISGAEALDEGRIRRQMLTKTSSMFSRRLFNPRVLDEDIAAIRNLYRDQGLLRATIDPPRIRLSTDAASADINLEIVEGPRFSIVGIEFADSELPYGHDQLLAWSGLAVGQIYSRSRILAAESELRGALDAEGYPDARVRTRVEVQDDSVRVQMELEPRGRKRVGEIRFVGNRRTKDRVLRRELELAPGDLISRDKILRTQHRLYQLGIFNNARLEYTPEGGDDAELQRLDVIVEEAPPLGMSFGVGYDTEGGGRASFSLTHENVGGRDRVAGFQGQISGILERIGFVAKEPRLFGRRVPALLDFSWEQREEVGYTVRRRSTAFRLDRKLGPRWRGYARYNFQRVDLFDVVDPSAVEQEKLEDLILGDIGVVVFRDTRNDPLMSTRGSYISVTNRVFAKPLASEAEFVKTNFGVSFVTTYGNGTAFAFSLRLGGAFPFGSTDSVPLSERFFAGGDSTLRGFPRDEVGPKSDLGLPTGGEALLLLNEEFRFPVRGNLKGVLFYDAGNVYSTTSDFDPGDLRHVLGLGVRFEMPVGPLRLEYGRKLDREPGESRGELFFAIGAAF